MRASQRVRELHGVDDDQVALDGYRQVGEYGGEDHGAAEIIVPDTERGRQGPEPVAVVEHRQPAEAEYEDEEEVGACLEGVMNRAVWNLL